MTPLLIFIGIPPAVAVGSEASQILASSFSGVIAHARRGNVDFRMGTVLVAGVLSARRLGSGCSHSCGRWARSTW